MVSKELSTNTWTTVSTYLKGTQNQGKPELTATPSNDAKLTTTRWMSPAQEKKFHHPSAVSLT